jgi:hypothetical protein
LAATVITISRKIQRIIQQDRNSRLGGLCKKLDMGKGCVRFKSGGPGSPRMKFQAAQLD